MHKKMSLFVTLFVCSSMSMQASFPWETAVYVAMPIVSGAVIYKSKQGIDDFIQFQNRLKERGEINKDIIFGAKNETRTADKGFLPASIAFAGMSIFFSGFGFILQDDAITPVASVLFTSISVVTHLHGRNKLAHAKAVANVTPSINDVIDIESQEKIVDLPSNAMNLSELQPLLAGHLTK